MTNKINEAAMLAEQEDMGLGLHEAPDRPQHAGNVAFTKAMMECIPKEEVPQEVKDKNPFQYKYEIKVKKVPKKLKNVAGLKEGITGRVVEVLDNKTVMIDFWTKTSPAKFPMRNVYLELSRTREQVEIDAGIIPEKEVEPPINGVMETVNRVTQTQSYPIKFDGGKPRMDLVRPEFTLALGEALAYGANKYNEQEGTVPNYLRGSGFNYSRIIGSLERHIAQWKMGQDVDEESGLSHLAMAAANLMFLHTYSLTEKGVDDRVVLLPNSGKVASEKERAEKRIQGRRTK
jgi:hypothetical protein